MAFLLSLAVESEGILMDKICVEDGYSRAISLREEAETLQKDLQAAHRRLHDKSTTKREWLGWLKGATAEKAESRRLQETAEDIRSRCDAFVVVGIGGSYLGAKAAENMFLSPFHNEQADPSQNTPRIYWAGHHLGGQYLTRLLKRLDEQEVAVNVISKSGTTTEPALSFHILEDYLIKRYGKEEASRRIVVTTDPEKGLLKKMAREKNYPSFSIPTDVGGRYSILTPVGLFPMAVMGIDIEAFKKGAEDAFCEYEKEGLSVNQTWRYAAFRHLWYRRGKKIEALVHYDPRLYFFGKWAQQLFGESEGKEEKGLFPVPLQYTTDLHSMGQYLQEGKRHLIETALWLEEAEDEPRIKEDLTEDDELYYLAGKTWKDVNEKAAIGTRQAHSEGGVPSIFIRIPSLTPYYFGALSAFFMKSCALSGYLLGVNPFDQPGVEAYKKQMFRLLKKPGYTI